MGELAGQGKPRPTSLGKIVSGTDMDMLLSKDMTGVIASCITLLSYVLYFRGILFFNTVPHAVSWFCWGLFGAVACAGQILGNGGAGAWPTGIGAFFCLVIAVIGVWRGGRQIRPVDYACLVIALVALVLWKLSSQPLVAVLIVTLADVTVMIPTVRKGWLYPEQETLSTFFLTALRHALGMMALSEYTLLTALYPAALIMSNLGFVLVVKLARRIRQRSQAGHA